MTKPSDLRLLAPSVLAGLMRYLEEIPEFAKIVASGFTSRQIDIIENENDGSVELILTLIYVQDYENPNADLDKNVLEAIAEYLSSRELLQYFIEINVNLSFLRQERQA